MATLLDLSKPKKRTTCGSAMIFLKICLIHASIPTDIAQKYRVARLSRAFSISGPRSKMSFEIWSIIIKRSVGIQLSFLIVETHPIYRGALASVFDVA